MQLGVGQATGRAQGHQLAVTVAARGRTFDAKAPQHLERGQAHRADGRLGDVGSLQPLDLLAPGLVVESRMREHAIE